MPVPELVATLASQSDPLTAGVIAVVWYRLDRRLRRVERWLERLGPEADPQRAD